METTQQSKLEDGGGMFEQEERICLTCGTPFLQERKRHGGRFKVFCSQRCQKLAIYRRSRGLMPTSIVDDAYEDLEGAPIIPPRPLKRPVLREAVCIMCGRTISPSSDFWVQTIQTLACHHCGGRILIQEERTR